MKEEGKHNHAKEVIAISPIKLFKLNSGTIEDNKFVKNKNLTPEEAT